MSDLLPVDPAIAIRAETSLADPDTCKFAVSRMVHPGGTFFFDSKERAAGSPLVERLFALTGVQSVLIAESVVTVGREPGTSWSGLKPAIGAAIRTQLLTGVPAILEMPRSASDNPNKPGRQKQPGHQKQIELERDCQATLIPSGENVLLSQGERVVLTQALGGSFTVKTEAGYLARIAPHDADALGFEVKPVSSLPEVTGVFDVQLVIDQLKTVFDPEIPVNVVDLGLVYACQAHPIDGGGHRVEIKMSMTAPGCGMGDVLKEDARARVQELPDVVEVDVEIVWDPPWDKSRMSEAARLELGMF